MFVSLYVLLGVAFAAPPCSTMTMKPQHPLLARGGGDNETLVGDDTDDLLNGEDGKNLSEGAEPHAGPLTVIDFAPEEDRLEVKLIYSCDEPPEVDVTSQVDAETRARNVLVNGPAVFTLTNGAAPGGEDIVIRVTEARATA